MSTDEVRYTIGIADCAASIDITNDKTGHSAMSISFIHTIRVTKYNFNRLPPYLGEFTLHKVQDYAQDLPENMAAKGGAFFPMHQNEAMYIFFEASEPFIVKVYVGGVNAISGEHCNEDLNTKFRRLEPHLSGEPVQDYVVLPAQLWLDDIAVSPGLVRQCVAMPLGDAYGIEAQMTGMQLEITPLKEKIMSGARPLNRVTVKTLTGKTIQVPCSSSWTVINLKRAYEEIEDIPADEMRLVFAGVELEDDQYLTTYGVEEDSIIHLMSRQGGGGTGCRPEMSIAAGGNIGHKIHEDTRPSEDWDENMTLTIPVHILNTDAYQQVTGCEPPPCPVMAMDYTYLGFPVSDLAEEPGVNAGGGGVDVVQSVNQVKQQRGLAEGPEDYVHPRVVTLGGDDATGQARRTEHLARAFRDDDGLLSPAGPYLPFRTAKHLRAELEATKKG